MIKPESIPELTDLEHETLRALVRAYGGDEIANLTLLMQADIDDEVEA